MTKSVGSWCSWWLHKNKVFFKHRVQIFDRFLKSFNKNIIKLYLWWTRSSFMENGFLKTSIYISITNPLTHLMLLYSSYTPWKHQKTSDFLMFSVCMEREQWLEWVDWREFNPTRTELFWELEDWGGWGGRGEVGVEVVCPR